MSTDLIYLASPYTSFSSQHNAAAEQEARFKQVSSMAGQLMEQGMKVFCPIAHSHPIAKYSGINPTDGDFWINQDLAILEHCNKLIVYKMPGWEQSRGVKMEIEFANKHSIPVEYLEF